MAKDELNKKQRLFACEYVKDFNALQAAKRAGYSAKSAHAQGSALLRHPLVKAEIVRLDQAMEARTLITAERIERELARVGFARLSDACSWSSAGVTLHPSDSVHPDAISAVKKVEHRRRMIRGPDGEPTPVEEEHVSIEMLNKTTALVELLKRRERAAELGDGAPREATIRIKFVDDTDDAEVID